MKNIKIIVVSTVFSLVIISRISAQENYLAVKSETMAINLNDKNYVRIYNGQIVDKNDIVKRFETIKHIEKVRAQELGLDFEMPVMIINSEKSDIESKIFEELFSRKDFIEKFKYPLDTRLPIIINSMYLTPDQRDEMLSKIEMKQITSIKYLDKQQADLKYNNFPFGVIDIEVKDGKMLPNTHR